MTDLAPGLLIAMPQLTDGNFKRSVVLMLEHNEHGSMGLVLTKHGGVDLGDLGRAQHLEVSTTRKSDPVFRGGPVEVFRGFVLHDLEDIEEKHPILPGLYLSVSSEALEPILLSNRGRVRLCLGYSGWGPKQIERELAQSSWLWTSATADDVLGVPADQLWDTSVRNMGIEPLALVMGGGIH